MPTVETRIARTEDQEAIFDLYRSLSPRSQRLRFFRAVSEVELLERARLEGKDDELALVAFDDGRLVGEARCMITPGEVPEFSVVVADDAQGRGVGRALVTGMLDLGHAHDVPALRGILRKENPEMLRMVRRIGTLISAPVEDGDVTFDLATGSGMPPWPDRPSRGRVLVEARTLLDSAIVTSLWGAGYEVRRCLGPPSRDDQVCPFLSGGRCLSAEGADAMAVLTRDARLRASLERHPARTDLLVAVTNQEWREFARRACQPGFTLPRRSAEGTTSDVPPEAQGPGSRGDAQERHPTASRH